MSLYRRARSPYWWSKLYVDGKPHAFSTRCRDKVGALAAERDEAKRLKSQAPTRGGHYPLSVVAAKLVGQKRADGRRDLTVSTLERILGADVQPHFGDDRDVRTITTADLEAFKAALVSTGKKANTVGQALSAIRQVLHYAVDVLKIMDAAPTVKNPRHRYEPKWRLLTVEEIGKLLAALAETDNRGREALPWALLVANTGMRMGRSGEVSKLTWAMVDLERREIRLPGAVTKTGRPRVVPLNDHALAALETMKGDRDAPKAGRVFRDRQHYQAWHRACADAGIGYARPYDLRHTFASLLHASGRPAVEIRDLLGHVTWSMMNHYAHAYEERLHEAVRSVTVSVTLDGKTGPDLVTNGQRRPPRGKAFHRRENQAGGELDAGDRTGSRIASLSLEGRGDAAECNRPVSLCRIDIHRRG